MSETTTKAPREPLDLAACRADIERAHTEVGDIAHDGAHRRWRMSIPARPDHDSDLIISAALTHAEHLADEVERLRAAIERVRADCKAQELGDNSDASRKTWALGVWAQARRTLNILNAARLAPERRREPLRELTHEAIDAGTYSEPAPNPPYGAHGHTDATNPTNAGASGGQGSTEAQEASR